MRVSSVGHRKTFLVGRKTAFWADRRMVFLVEAHRMVLEARRKASWGDRTMVLVDRMTASEARRTVS